tara:strand:- start:2003 stop:2809 length:807 start_codon:yes stop_codon:yes gene_type:complete
MLNIIVCYILIIGSLTIKVVAISQARMNSSRFPGKILQKIDSSTLLDIHIKRILMAKKINKFILATTTNKEDDVIAKHCEDNNLLSYRGSERDVLDRFFQASKIHKCDYILRLTSDCPLIDPKLIDKIIEYCQYKELDYCSNTLSPTYPDGQDIEIIKISALKKAWKEAKKNSDREHVTPYIWRNSNYLGGEIFNSYNFEEGYDYGDLRMTVDTVEDFMLIKAVIKKMGLNCTWKEYSDYIKSNSSLYNINVNNNRNDGYIKSIQKDT